VAIVTSLSSEQINQIVVSVIPIPKDAHLEKAHYGFYQIEKDPKCAVIDVLRKNEYDVEDLDVQFVEDFGPSSL